MSLTFLSTQKGKIALENAKLTFGLVRDLSIGLLLLLLLAWPEAINNRLTAAGFEEGSFMSLKWKKKVVQDDAALKEAQAIILRQQEQLNGQRKALDALQKKLPEVAALPEVARLQKKSSELAAQSEAGLDALQSTISSNRGIVERASKAASDPRWVVIFGGDVTSEDARYEINRAKGRLPEPQIMYRSKSYRSISILLDRDAAYAVLPTARQLNKNAYAVSLAGWCPRYQKRDDYLECTET
jgi:hypothetical protein